MKLIEYFQEGNELFNALITYPDYVTSAIQSAVTDIARYDYGLRTIRPYLEYLTTLPDDQQITPSLDAVVKSAVLSYCKKWEYKYTGLFESEAYSYDPIENYSMTEIMTDDTTETTYGKTDTRTLVKDSSDTRTYDVTDERTPDLTSTHNLNDLTNTETDQIQGFDSSDWNDANKKTSVGSGSDTTTETGTDTNTKTGTDTMAYAGTDTDTNVQSGTDTATRNYTLTRSGNIGVTTSQQMAQSERDLRNFSAVVEFAHGLVNELTIGVY